jgi:chorismate dehydratase
VSRRDPLRGLRVGRLPYLNVWPFHARWRGGDPTWVTAPPRRLGGMAAAGELDAALLASRDALALAGEMRPLGGLGIACRGAVASVLVFSRRPLAELGGGRVALTGESRTSRGLLRILLAERYGLGGLRYGEDAAGADAWLLIGDAALGRRAEVHDAAHVADLGEQWYAWTGLPFVYARWMVRRDLPARRAAALETALRRSLREGEGARPAAADVPAGVSPPQAAVYLDRFDYLFGPDEEAAYQRFHRELLRHDLLRHHSPGRALGAAA